MSESPLNEPSTTLEELATRFQRSTELVRLALIDEHADRSELIAELRRRGRDHVVAGNRIYRFELRGAVPVIVTEIVPAALKTEGGER